MIYKVGETNVIQIGRGDVKLGYQAYSEDNGEVCGTLAFAQAKVPGKPGDPVAEEERMDNAHTILVFNNVESVKQMIGNLTRLRYDMGTQIWKQEKAAERKARGAGNG